MSGSLVEHILHARVNFHHGQKNSLCLQQERKQGWRECRYTPKRSADSCAQNATLIRFPPSVEPCPLWCCGSMRTSYARTCSLDLAIGFLWMLTSTKLCDDGYVQILINYTAYYVCKRKCVLTNNILSSKLFGFFQTGIENRSLCP